MSDNSKFSNYVNYKWRCIQRKSIMVKSLAAESMDNVKTLFISGKISHNCKCKDCLQLPLHLQLNELTAETGLDIMSEYCFHHGCKHLGSGIQQSIWSATNVC